MYNFNINCENEVFKNYLHSTMINGLSKFLMAIDSNN